MSREKDIKICKWMVGQKLLSKEDAKKALQKQAALEKKGKDLSIITILFKTNIIDEDTAKKLKKKFNKSADATPEKKEKAKPVKTKKAINKKSKPAPPPPEEDEPDDVSIDEASRDEDSQSEEATVQTVVDDDDGRVKTCSECQSAIPLSAKDCQICAAPQPLVSSVHCPTCHRISPSNVKHCNFCGCDIAKGTAGPNSQKCGGCKNIVLPDEALCKICGDIQVKGKAIKVPQTGKMFLAAILIICYGALAFGMYSIGAQRVKPKKVAKRAPPPVQRMDTSPIQLIPSNQQTRQILIECMELARKSQWKNISDKIEKSSQGGYVDKELIELWATSYIKTGKLNLITQLHKRIPKNKYVADLAVEVMIKQMRDEIKNNDLDRALDLAKTCLDIDDQFAKSQFWYGVIQYKKGNHSIAEKAFQKTVKFDSNWYEAYFFLYLLNRTDDNTGTAKTYLKAFKTNANSNNSFSELLKKL